MQNIVFLMQTCFKCEKKLEEEQKHHCRACGRGFCDDCTAYQRPVPERGWPTAVRVCEDCYSVNMTGRFINNKVDIEFIWLFYRLQRNNSIVF